MLVFTGRPLRRVLDRPKTRFRISNRLVRYFCVLFNNTQRKADEEACLGPRGYVRREQLLAAGAYPRLRGGRLSCRSRLCCRRGLLFFDSALARNESSEGAS